MSSCDCRSIHSPGCLEYPHPPPLVKADGVAELAKALGEVQRLRAALEGTLNAMAEKKPVRAIKIIKDALKVKTK